MAVPIKEVQSFERVKKQWEAIQANPEVLEKRQNGGLKPHAQASEQEIETVILSTFGDRID